MIISASYKTDIPAFYGEWFRNRLQADFCRVVNPFNRNHHYKVSLARSDVDGFVFWTKNLGPFLDTLDEVHRRGFPFVVQYTINGYPRSLESRVVDSTRSVEHMRLIAEEYGQRVAVWRYDTIIFSSLTPAEFHKANFEALARELAGTTDEVVVSFMQIYKKTQGNMDRASSEHEFEWEDPSPAVKRSLLADLIIIAEQHGMKLTICTQPNLVVPGASEARCVDAMRLMDIGGRNFRVHLKGMRKGCGCFNAKDIGDYDTCPHGCVYCYAVRNRKLALARYQAHDPKGEFLFPVQLIEPRGEPPRGQIDLFTDSLRNKK